MKLSLVVAAAFVTVGALGMAGACTPADRVELARTALDSADRGCRAYLELRKEPLVVEPAADAGPDAKP